MDAAVAERPVPLCGSNLEFLWRSDPRMIGIRMARYKFAAKVLAGCERVLEIGAGDGQLANIVRQTVGRVTCCDLDPQGGSVMRCDLVKESPRGAYDGMYALDVLEHVSPADEEAFMRNLVRPLLPIGTCVIGTPSLESQAYASEISLKGHVNCKTEEGLRALLKRHFRNVYLFGMNDETLHTGFGPMCHYRLAVCTGVIS